ncbi:MAG: hypothetical protein AAF493_20115 [Pseudomonadota bacterium]
MVSYWRAHWQGEHSFAQAFWGSFFVPFVLILFVEPLIFRSSIASAGWYFIGAALFFIGFRLVLLPWQIIGVIRAADKYGANYGDPLRVRAAYVTIMVAVVVALASSFTTLQTGLGIFERASALPSSPGARPSYEIVALSDSTIAIRGDIQPGITKRLRATLRDRPTVRRIALSSTGGHVFEARGIAKLIVDGALDTYVIDACQSSCTLAFIAGKKRYLAPGATLGFHQYQLQSDRPNPLFDVNEEQEKDRRFVASQGIDPRFVTRLFDTAPSALWIPENDVLLDAHVVHAIESIPN